MVLQDMYSSEDRSRRHNCAVVYVKLPWAPVSGLTYRPRSLQNVLLSLFQNICRVYVEQYVPMSKPSPVGHGRTEGVD